LRSGKRSFAVVAEALVSGTEAVGSGWECRGMDSGGGGVSTI